MTKLLGMSRRIRIPRVKASRRLGVRVPGGVRVSLPLADAAPVPTIICGHFGHELPAGWACPPGCKLVHPCFEAFVKVMP